MYALFERIDNEKQPWKRKLQITRFQLSGNVSVNQTTVRRPVASKIENDENDDEEENNTNQYSMSRDSFLFVVLDVKNPMNRDLIGPFRAIYDNVKLYSKSTNCLKYLQYSNEKIFFITTSNDKDLIKQVQDCSSIEAIFIFNTQGDFDQIRFPKFIGMYRHSEELLAALKHAFEWFQESQFDFYTFEREQLFLYLQIWREFIRPMHPQINSTKSNLVEFAEKYYRGNMKLLKSLDDFDYCYEKNEVLQWCFVSPFPSEFLRHALVTRHIEHIDRCRFLLSDISKYLHQTNEQKMNRQFFKGVKISHEDLAKLSKYAGKLMCPKGFFTCQKSRKLAIDVARGNNYRPDLRSVLFKITCPPNVPVGEISSIGLVVFDVYMAFRIKCVNRGPISIVKIEPADDDGRNCARNYRSLNKTEKIDKLLEQLADLPKPSVNVQQKSPTPPPSLPLVEHKRKKEKIVHLFSPAPTVLSKEEIRAQKLAQHGQVDQALTAYQNLKNQNPRILNTVGQIYADKKGDYTSAIKYYRQAMTMQEKNDEDISETLTQLGIAHHNRREFDLALDCHNRAFEIRQKKSLTNQPRPDLAGSLIGIANAQWGQDNLTEAYQNAMKALEINQSIETGNELNLAMNLAILANIHHRAGDDKQALDYITRALNILEQCIEPDSLTLASILNNMGTIQVCLDMYNEAQSSFHRALQICEKNLPEGHPKRVTMEKNIQRIGQLERANVQ